MREFWGELLESLWSHGRVSRSFWGEPRGVSRESRETLGTTPKREGKAAAPKRGNRHHTKEGGGGKQRKLKKIKHNEAAPPKRREEKVAPHQRRMGMQHHPKGGGRTNLPFFTSLNFVVLLSSDSYQVSTWERQHHPQEAEEGGTEPLGTTHPGLEFTGVKRLGLAICLGIVTMWR